MLVSLPTTRKFKCIMPSGVVKYCHAEKGRGFITPDAGGTDVFVHRSAAAASGIEDDGSAYLPHSLRVIYQVEWDENAGNWRVSKCTGFELSTSSSNSSCHWENGRRLKHPDALGLNQHEFAKYATSSQGARARRRAKRHPELMVDYWEL